MIKKLVVYSILITILLSNNQFYAFATILQISVAHILQIKILNETDIIEALTIKNI